ncbi:hypothetical protein [Actinomadura algeriensis]|uniref:Uncharacterized protein n=1 Tax=Actinomadura algeriensis TaxID=1679523 RepID=A0ABR9JQD4_9ACTN|nr:hypothetical protein [Actinomadura algeriensis]MBE1532608.1 hypothetical protein [Actinomadura algeriensis]
MLTALVDVDARGALTCAADRREPARTGGRADVRRRDTSAGDTSTA